MRFTILIIVFTFYSFSCYSQTYNYSNVIHMDDMENEGMRTGKNITSYVGGIIKVDKEKNRLVVSNEHQSLVYKIISIKQVDKDVTNFDLEYKLSTTGEIIKYTANLDKFYLKFKLYSGLSGTQIYGLTED